MRDIATKPSTAVFTNQQKAKRLVEQYSQKLPRIHDLYDLSGPLDSSLGDTDLGISNQVDQPNKNQALATNDAVRTRPYRRVSPSASSTLFVGNQIERDGTGPDHQTAAQNVLASSSPSSTKANSHDQDVNYTPNVPISHPSVSERSDDDYEELQDETDLVESSHTLRKDHHQKLLGITAVVILFALGTAAFGYLMRSAKETAEDALAPAGPTRATLTKVKSAQVTPLTTATATSELIQSKNAVEIIETETGSPNQRSVTAKPKSNSSVSPQTTRNSTNRTTRSPTQVDSTVISKSSTATSALPSPKIETSIKKGKSQTNITFTGRFCAASHSYKLIDPDGNGFERSAKSAAGLCSNQWPVNLVGLIPGARYQLLFSVTPKEDGAQTITETINFTSE
jgi:hypothetical protein